MARLTHSDFRALLDCLVELYAHHDLDTFGPHATQLGFKLLPCSYAACSGVNARTKRGWYRTCPAGLDFGLSKEDMSNIADIHPLMTHYQRTGDVSARKMSDFLPRRAYRESPLYREYFRKLGVEYMMVSYLPERPPDSVAVTLVRDRRDFSERERLLLNLLQPHLFQAYHNAETIHLLRDEAALAKQALDASPEGIVTLSGKGAVRFCSARARRLLADYFDAPRQKSQLPHTLRSWFCSHQFPTGGKGNLPAPRQPLRVDRPGRRLTVRLVADSSPGQQTLVMQEQRTEFSAAALRPLGLTAREAEILLWVAQGKTNPEIGTILGLSVGTVHKHTEHIFEKLGVETRTAAAAQAFELFSQDPG